MAVKTKTNPAEKTALEFQKLDREIKALQAKQKPLKKTLIDYAQEHKTDFDEAFQLKFKNGTYISQRVKDVVDGSKDAKQQLLDENPEYAETKLDEKAVIEAAPADNHLRKKLTKLGLQITQKETFAVYAG